MYYRFKTIFIIAISLITGGVIKATSFELVRPNKVTIIEEEHIYHNMEKLCRAWGIIKYFHPAVAKGDFDIDQELFIIIPKTILMEDSFNIILKDWVKQFGQINQENIDKMLDEIQSLERIFPGKYISYQAFKGNPIFSNEKVYAEMKEEDVGLRMLALFRYWNIINYFYPYKHLLKDWDVVLRQYIPIFAKADTRKAYQEAIMRLCGEIKDGHATIYDGILNMEAGTYIPLHISFWGKRVAPNNLMFIGDTLVANGDKPLLAGKALKHPIRRGDIILAINNRRIKDIVADRMPLMSASNKNYGLYIMSASILCTDDSLLKVTYQHGEKIRHCALKTYPLKDVDLFFNPQEQDSCFKIIDNIAYINPATWKNQYFRDIWPQVLHSDGLIIDLREYPNEYLDFASKLYYDTVDVVKMRVMNVRHPGKFNDVGLMKIYGDSSCYKGNIVILNDERSISQSEFTTMLFRRSPHVVVMGSPTAGTDGDISMIALPGGIFTYISGIEILYPDGGQTQQIGLIPDIIVKPTVKSIVDGDDYLLQQALKLLKSKNSY